MAGDAAIEIAEAVKNALNDGDFGDHTFTATRAYDLFAELKIAGKTCVNVAVREESGEVASRESTEEEVSIDIVVRRKCDVDDLSILDGLMGLLKQIKDTFVATRLDTATFGEAWCHGWERSPAYFQEHIQQYRQFTGLLTLKFSIALDL